MTDLADFHLTRREMDVARLLLGGLGNKSIGRLLCITPDAVKHHMRGILLKTHSVNRTMAALKLAGY